MFRMPSHIIVDPASSTVVQIVAFVIGSNAVEGQTEEPSTIATTCDPNPKFVVKQSQEDPVNRDFWSLNVENRDWNRHIRTL